MKKIILATMLLPLLFGSCKKKEENKEPTKTEILKMGQWKVTEVYVAKNDTVIFDYYSQMLDCAKDNFYTFNANNSITSDEGASKCDESVEQVTTDGKWTLTNNDKTFTISDSKILPLSGDQSMNVGTIDNTTIKLTKDTTIVYPGIGELSGTIHATFKKK
jgi:hypothetical protein